MKKVVLTKDEKQQMAEAKEVLDTVLKIQHAPFNEVRGAVGIMYVNPTTYFVKDEKGFFWFVGKDKPREFRGKRPEYFESACNSRYPFLKFIGAMAITVLERNGREFPVAYEGAYIYDYITACLEFYNLRVKEKYTSIQGILKIAENEPIEVASRRIEFDEDGVYHYSGSPLEAREGEEEVYFRLTKGEIMDMVDAEEGILFAGKRKYTYKYYPKGGKRVKLVPHHKWNLLVKER